MFEMTNQIKEGGLDSKNAELKLKINHLWVIYLDRHKYFDPAC